MSNSGEVLGRQSRQGKIVAFRKLVMPAVTAVLVATIATGMSAGQRGDRENDDEQEEGRSYAIGLWGDLPYSDLQALTGVPNLIADMNSAATSRSPSTTATSRPATARPARSRRPSAATRCTCRRSGYLQRAEGAGDVHARRQRLDRLRSAVERRLQLARTARSRAAVVVLQHAVLARPAPAAAGGADRRALPRRQAGAHVPCVENRRWTLRRRHLRDAQRPGLLQQPVRHRRPIRPNGARATRPTSPGCSETFDEAKAHGSVAVMIIAQADPGWDLTRRHARAAARSEDARRDRREPPDGFQDYLLALRERGHRVRQAGRLRARRLALLPHRQAAARRAGPPARELHARRDLRRQPGQRQQRRALGQGAGRSTRAARSSPIQPQIVPANRVAVPVP